MSLDLPPYKLPPVVLREAAGSERVLTPKALAFLAELTTAFADQIRSLLSARQMRQHGYDLGRFPEFLEETTEIRKEEWKVATAVAAIARDHIAYSGPVDPRTTYEAATSIASEISFDFGDSLAPRFASVIAAQAALSECLAARATGAGTSSSLRVSVTPRGLHLEEANLLIEGRAVPAAIFDFGLAVFQARQASGAKSATLLLRLEKLENHREARLWQAMLAFAEDRLGIEGGGLGVIVQIDSLRAAFEMDEIIHEMRDRIVALSLEPVGYSFSYLKTLREHAAYGLPGLERIDLATPAIAGVARRLLGLCGRRGIAALGTVSALDPVALTCELRQWVELGFDGLTFCHVDVLSTGAAILSGMRGQGSHSTFDAADVSEGCGPDLMIPDQRRVSENLLQSTIAFGVEYLSQWLRGTGQVVDGGTVRGSAAGELARMQLWHWLRHGAEIALKDGDHSKLSQGWVANLIQKEIVAVLTKLGVNAFHRGRYASAARILLDAATASLPPDFITLEAYDMLNALD